MAKTHKQLLEDVLADGHTQWLLTKATHAEILKEFGSPDMADFSFEDVDARFGLRWKAIQGALAVQRVYQEQNEKDATPVIVAARQLVAGKRDHVHPDGSTEFLQDCQTCRLIKAIDDYEGNTSG